MVSSRNRQPELMDQPELAPGVHRHALAGLGRINRISRTSSVLWRSLLQLQKQVGDLRVLDLACGGGDVALECAQWARRQGVAMEFHGCDVSATAIAYAKSAAAETGATGIEFSCLDVLRDELPRGYDVIMTTLFLHHLDAPNAVELLRRMAAAARKGVLVDDLLRSRLALGMAWLGCQLLTRSPIVHVDGPRSVRAAFTLNEAQFIVQQAGLKGATFRRHWPARFLMQWIQR